MIKYWSLIVLMLFSFQKNACALFGMDAAAMIPYLIQIISESIKQYEELKRIYDTTNKYKEILDRYHQGIEEALRMLEGIPIRDQNILSTIRSFRDAISDIEGFYGKIPNSPEARMLKLHDESVAESIKIVGDLKTYAAGQEKNADLAMTYAKDASPKGTARVSVEINAAILHTLNQLLRVNGQMLKIMSENLAYTNKGGKDSVLHYNRLNRDMGTSLKSFNGDFKTPRFD